jgi:hypothetical protein
MMLLTVTFGVIVPEVGHVATSFIPLALLVGRALCPARGPRPSDEEARAASGVPSFFLLCDF